jgi:hypothetical protein
MSLLSKVYRIKSELKTNREISKSERNKLLGKLNQLNGEIRDISVLMGKDIIEQGKGRIGFVGDVGAMYSYEDVTVWEAKSKVEDLINTDTFDYLVLQGETYSLEINRVSAIWAVDDYIADIVASQRENKIQTPMVRIIADSNNFTISVE